MRFSQRKGYTPLRVEIQREEISDSLRNKLWSALTLAVIHHAVWFSEHGQALRELLWLYFFNEPMDRLPSREHYASTLRTWFFKADWFAVYDLFEAVYKYLPDIKPREDLVSLTNTFLETELSAYRLIDGQITGITDAQEVESIEAAGRDTEPFGSVRAHLREGLAKLSDRKNPDYRNSIKEAISAVEGMCKIIAGDSKATLGTAIKKLKDSGVPLHPALEKAWLILYGYTSDAGGIRHALSDDPQIGFSEAKYMLVSCSAFVSHLIELSRQAGIKLGKGDA